MIIQSGQTIEVTEEVIERTEQTTVYDGWALKSLTLDARASGETTVTATLVPINTETGATADSHAVPIEVPNVESVEIEGVQEALFAMSGAVLAVAVAQGKV